MSQKLGPGGDDDLDYMASEEFSHVGPTLAPDPHGTWSKPAGVTPESYAFPTQPGGGNPYRSLRK
jgi:hypothetical protein